MKVRVTEIRKAEFREYHHATPHCDIDVTYEVLVIIGDTQDKKTFDRIEDVEQYIHYLKEKENDYSKVIKEIEI